MPRTTDRLPSAIHQRAEIAKFDHDCPGGHGPECQPFEVTVEEGWFDVNGRPIEGAEQVALLEQRRRQKGED